MNGVDTSELKPCPFCGSQPEPAPYVLKCVNAYCEAQPSVSGGNDDECATAWNKRALLVEQARPEQETDRDWSEAQDWKGMDGAQAWHLIYRHADGWGDTGAMMNAWLAANAAPPMTHKAEDAPSDELLDSRGKIRSDLKSSAYCVGNEYKPFHPSASHVRPEWRDGWNACFVAAIAQERKA